MSPPFEVRRWLHLQMSQLVGRCTSRRVYLDRDLDAVPYIGTDGDCRRMACHGDLSLSLLRTGYILTWGGSTIPTQPMGCCRMRLTKIVAFVTISTTQSELIQCPLKDIRSFIRSRKFSKVSAFVIRLGSSRYLPQQLQEL